VQGEEPPETTKETTKDMPGSMLIESAIPTSTVSREFRSKGLVCTIEVPV
jgi:hypothetical protein